LSYVQREVRTSELREGRAEVHGRAQGRTKTTRFLESPFLVPSLAQDSGRGENLVLSFFLGRRRDLVLDRCPGDALSGQFLPLWGFFL
jgi:hypothetical protein